MSESSGVDDDDCDTRLQTTDRKASQSKSSTSNASNNRSVHVQPISLDDTRAQKQIQDNTAAATLSARYSAMALSNFDDIKAGVEVENFTTLKEEMALLTTTGFASKTRHKLPTVTVKTFEKLREENPELFASAAVTQPDPDSVTNNQSPSTSATTGDAPQTDTQKHRPAVTVTFGPQLPPHLQRELPLQKVDANKVIEVVKRALSELPRIRIFHNQQAITSKDACNIINGGGPNIPLLSASYISTLMRESGPYTSPSGSKHDLPPCAPIKQGGSCIMASTTVDGHQQFSVTGVRPPRPLMGFMYPGEFDLMIREQKMPSERRPCGACIMFAVEKAIHACANLALNVRLDQCMLMMPFRVAYDVPNGFYRTHVHEPSARTWMGFIDPFLRFDVSFWRWRQDETGSCRTRSSRNQCDHCSNGGAIPNTQAKFSFLSGWSTVARNSSNHTSQPSASTKVERDLHVKFSQKNTRVLIENVSTRSGKQIKNKYKALIVQETESLAVHAVRMSTRRVDWLLNNLKLINCVGMSQPLAAFTFAYSSVASTELLQSTSQMLHKRIGRRLCRVLLGIGTGTLAFNRHGTVTLLRRMGDMCDDIDLLTRYFNNAARAPVDIPTVKTRVLSDWARSIKTKNDATMIDVPPRQDSMNRSALLWGVSRRVVMHHAHTFTINRTQPKYRRPTSDTKHTAPIQDALAKRRRQMEAFEKEFEISLADCGQCRIDITKTMQLFEFWLCARSLERDICSICRPTCCSETADAVACINEFVAQDGLELADLLDVMRLAACHCCIRAVMAVPETDAPCDTPTGSFYDRASYHLHCCADAVWFAGMRVIARNSRFRGAECYMHAESFANLVSEARDLSMEPSYVISEATIHRLVRLETAYGSEGKVNKKLPLDHLVLKARLRPSASRMYNSVADPYVERDINTRRILVAYLACSLLGNYAHLRYNQNRGTHVLRAYINQELHVFTASKHIEWSFFKFLVLYIPVLLLHATQQNIISRTLYSPSLTHFANATVELTVFCRVVNNACMLVRARLSEFFTESIQCTHTLDIDALAIVCSDVSVALKLRAHKQLLGLSYTKVLRDFVTGVKSSIKSVKPVWDHPLLQIHPDQMMRELGVSVAHFEAMKQIVEQCDTTFTFKEMFMFIVLRYFGSPVDARRVVASISVAYEAGTKIKGELQKLKLYYPHTYSLVQCFSWLWARHSAIQTFQLPSHYTLAQLEVHSSKYGKQDISGSGSTCSLPVGAVASPVCPVCMHLSLCIRNFVVNKPRIKKKTTKQLKLKRLQAQFANSTIEVSNLALLANSSNHGSRSGGADDTSDYTEKAGFENVAVDLSLNLETPVLYCRHGDSVLREACGAHPMQMTMMTGVAIQYRNMIILQCPGVGCGECMVLDPKCAALDDRGCYVCARCTAKIVQARNDALPKDAGAKPTADNTPNARHGGTTQLDVKSFTCDVCQKNCKHARRITVLENASQDVKPLTITVCRKHKTQHFEHHLQQVNITRVPNKECTGGLDSMLAPVACKCNSIERTCTGHWTRESLLRFVQTTTESSAVTIARRANTHNYNVSRLPNRRPARPRSKQNS